MNNLTIHGVNFNIDWVKTKTYKQFYEHFKHIFKDLTEDEREKRLKKVWDFASTIIEFSEFKSKNYDIKVINSKKKLSKKNKTVKHLN